MQRIYRQVSKRQTAAVLVTAGLPPTTAQQAIQAQAARAAATQAQNPGSDGFRGNTAWTALATAVLSSVGLYAYTQQRSSALCEEQRASSGQTVVRPPALIRHELLARWMLKPRGQFEPHCGPIRMHPSAAITPPPSMFLKRPAAAHSARAVRRVQSACPGTSPATSRHCQAMC